MKCPLITAAEVAHEPEVRPSENDCLKEECAWWNKFTDECAIYMLALETNALRAAMQDIKDKMSHKG